MRLCCHGVPASIAVCFLVAVFDVGSSAFQPVILSSTTTGDIHPGLSVRVFKPQLGRAYTRLESIANLKGGGSDGDGGRSFNERASICLNFSKKNSFLMGMFVAVWLARAFPWLGKDGGLTRPELFIGKFGVMCIFLLSGLSLDVSELKQAASNIKLNAAVQLLIFGVWPFLVGLPLVKILGSFSSLPRVLLDGLLILTCLPTTVNMCILLTSAAGGSVPSALCNAVISNLLGVFLTPALILLFFGTSTSLPFLDMVLKLCNKVLLPVGVGQVLRQIGSTKELSNKHSKLLKKFQELILLGIVWNAFCNAFSEGLGLELRHALALLAIIPTLHLAAIAGTMKLFSQPFWKFSRSQVVAAMFTSSQKTLAFGLPLVNTIFEGNPNLATYCAPIMIVHPLQLIIGSFLLPRLRDYTQDEANK